MICGSAELESEVFHIFVEVERYIQGYRATGV